MIATGLNWPCSEDTDDKGEVRLSYRPTDNYLYVKEVLKCFSVGLSWALSIRLTLLPLRSMWVLSFTSMGTSNMASRNTQQWVSERESTDLSSEGSSYGANNSCVDIQAQVLKPREWGAVSQALWVQVYRPNLWDSLLHVSACWVDAPNVSRVRPALQTIPPWKFKNVKEEIV